jgi:hypothetical protein
MFGHHKRKRERKKLKRQKAELEQDKKSWEDQSPERQKEQSDFQKSQAQEKTDQAKEDRKKGREEGRQYAEELFNRDIEGLNPKKKAALQYEANKQVQRQHQSANRKLLGDQSMHGIVGKGGVGYAQQRDLQKVANEAQGQATRDIDKLDADLAMKKLAAMFNIEQGEAAQTQLDKQLALDELKLDDEKKRQKYFEDQFNRLFSRI